MADDWGNPEDWGDGSKVNESGFDDFDAGDVDADDVGSGRVEVTNAGFYHFELDAKSKPECYRDNDMNKPCCPHILVTCTVLESNEHASSGAVHFHQVILGGKGGGPIETNAKRSTLNFLVGCGILKKAGDLIIDPETNSPKINSATLEKRLKGIQIIGKLEMDKPQPGSQYGPRPRFNFGRGAFQVDDPAVAHVKKNLDALKAIGKAPAPNGSAPPATAPQPKQVAPQQAPQPAERKTDMAIPMDL